jgi:DnaJ-class molecular chaperone
MDKTICSQCQGKGKVKRWIVYDAGPERHEFVCPICYGAGILMPGFLSSDDKAGDRV